MTRDDTDVLIAGAGFAGLTLAIALRLPGSRGALAVRTIGATAR